MADKEIGSEGEKLVALVADLLFAARIRGSEPAARVVQALDRLVPLLGPQTRLVIVDVQASQAAEAIREARARADNAEVVAFGPHVAESALEAARNAGAHRVLPRGQFVKVLPQLVRQV